MSELGRVLKASKEDLLITMPRDKKCVGCHICTYVAGSNQMQLKAINGCGAREGDLVQVEIRKSGELSATMIAYGIPLGVFLLSIVLFSLFATELITIVLSTLTTALSFLLIRYFVRRQSREQYLPKAVRVVQPSAPSTESTSSK